MKFLLLVVTIFVHGFLSAQTKPSSKVRDPFGSNTATQDSTKHIRKDSIERFWVEVPEFTFPIEEECVIVLDMIVDEDGNIISATHSQLRSTTTNTALISELIATVKRRGKFNAVPGLKKTYIQRTFKLAPQ